MSSVLGRLQSLFIFLRNFSRHALLSLRITKGDKGELYESLPRQISLSSFSRPQGNAHLTLRFSNIDS